MHRSPVPYPAEALARGVEGTVVVQVKLDAKGEVADAAVLSGPDELRRAAQQSVLTWHFDKSVAMTTQVVNIDFSKAAADNAQPADKVLFDQATDKLDHRDYAGARLTLNTLINTYGASENPPRAKLAIADTWFREGGARGLAQAEAEYKDFILFYPNLKEARGVPVCRQIGPRRKAGNVASLPTFAPPRHPRPLRLPPSWSRIEVTADCRIRLVTNCCRVCRSGKAPNGRHKFPYAVRSQPCRSSIRTLRIVLNRPDGAGDPRAGRSVPYWTPIPVFSSGSGGPWQPVWAVVWVVARAAAGAAVRSRLVLQPCRQTSSGLAKV